MYVCVRLRKEKGFFFAVLNYCGGVLLLYVCIMYVCLLDNKQQFSFSISCELTLIITTHKYYHIHTMKNRWCVITTIIRERKKERNRFIWKINESQQPVHTNPHTHKPTHPMHKILNSNLLVLCGHGQEPKIS